MQIQMLFKSFKKCPLIKSVPVIRIKAYKKKKKIAENEGNFTFWQENRCLIEDEDRIFIAFLSYKNSNNAS